jgi:hypothetical protein
MKKLLTFAVLLLLPLFASAREIEPVLAPDGALYSVHARQASETPDVETAAAQYLVLETRRGTDIHTQIIPATNTKGAHGSAAMAYDPQSKTLFVFWLHATGMTSSELVFASVDAEGVWSEPTAFGMPYNGRENLRIAVTNNVYDKAEDKVVPGLSVHAVWWEFDSQRVDGRWSAQYAVFAIENGKVADIDFLDLSSLVRDETTGTVAAASQTSTLADVPSGSVLRHPQLFAASTQDSVYVLFGDVPTDKLYQARISPIKANGRLRVPVGRRGNKPGLPGPRVHSGAGSTTGSIFGDEDRIAFYVRDGEKLRYSILRNDTWSDPQTIELDSRITSAAAVDAIRRLLNH